jgi:hypothetical protein
LTKIAPLESKDKYDYWEKNEDFYELMEQYYKAVRRLKCI